MSEPKTLPVELVDHVFKMLRSDVSSLQKCASVNRVFHDIAEKHIYNTVVVHNSVQPSYGLLSTTAPQLSKLISDSPHIISHIKALEVVITHPSVLKWFTTRTLADQEIGYILPKLLCLEHISLNGWTTWHSLHKEFQQTLINAFGSILITTIVINRIESFPITILNSCPNLKRLSLIQGSFNPGVDELWKIDIHRPCLEALTIDDSPAAITIVVDWLSGFIDTSNIQYLHVIGSEAYPGEQITRLLSMCTESLKDFELDVGRQANINDNFLHEDTALDHTVPYALDLSNMHHLCSLSLTIDISYREFFWVSSTEDDRIARTIHSTPFAWLTRTFTTAPPSLSHVEVNVSFDVETWESLEQIRWHSFVQSVSTLALRHLDLRVAFKGKTTPSLKGDRTLVGSLENNTELSKLIKKGVLFISNKRFDNTPYVIPDLV